MGWWGNRIQYAALVRVRGARVPPVTASALLPYSTSRSLTRRTYSLVSAGADRSSRARTSATAPGGLVPIRVVLQTRILTSRNIS